MLSAIATDREGRERISLWRQQLRVTENSTQKSLGRADCERTDGATALALSFLKKALLLT